jgi:hypothetical protein
VAYLSIAEQITGQHFQTAHVYLPEILPHTQQASFEGSATNFNEAICCNDEVVSFFSTRLSQQYSISLSVRNKIS